MNNFRKKIRLLFHVQILLAGGIEKVLIELLQALPQDRFEIGLLITHHLGKHETLKDQIPADIRIQYLLEPDWLNWAKLKKMTSSFNVAEKLFSEMLLPPFQKKVIRKRLPILTKDVDVFIDFDMTLGAYHDAIFAKRKVTYCHFSLTHYWNGNARKLNTIAKRLAQNDNVIMLCDEMKADAEKMFPFLAPKLSRLYNALDMERVRTKATEALTGFEQFEKIPFFLSVGRLEESQKDFTTLIRAYAKCVREHHLTEPLVIVGQGGHEQMLQTLARREGMEDRIVFTGFQVNPYKWMTRAKLFLFSSRFEGLPTVLLEALTLGCPIIATECPTGVKEILMYGKAGQLVPVGDTEAMSEAISELENDAARKESYRKAAQQITQQFDIRFMIAEFERIVINGD